MKKTIAALIIGVTLAGCNDAPEVQTRDNIVQQEDDGSFAVVPCGTVAQLLNEALEREGQKTGKAFVCVTVLQ